jgi:hypothetical protein
MQNPIAKRLKNAPSNAARLSGNFSGSMAATASPPKISPHRIPRWKVGMAEA